MTDDGYKSIFLIIGHRLMLTTRDAHKAAVAFRLARSRHPAAEIYFGLDGFDDDPRPLWHIPEVPSYVAEWARLSGVDTLAKASAVPWVSRRESIALLANCGALGLVPIDEVEAAIREKP
jgi:hypothetical protein